VYAVPLFGRSRIGGAIWNNELPRPPQTCTDGLVAAGLTSYLERMLFELTPLEPPTFARLAENECANGTRPHPADRLPASLAPEETNGQDFA
jgi:hypothetical protein